MEKAIGKALQDAGLGEREVTEKGSWVNLIIKEGLISHWNPTEKQANLIAQFCFHFSCLLALYTVLFAFEWIHLCMLI